MPTARRTRSESTPFPGIFLCWWILQIVTDVLAAPVFVFRKGAFAWNGAISSYEATVIFGSYLGCLILLVRKAIWQQPPGERVPE